MNISSIIHEEIWEEIVQKVMLLLQQQQLRLLPVKQNTKRKNIP